MVSLFFCFFFFFFFLKEKLGWCCVGFLGRTKGGEGIGWVVRKFMKNQNGGKAVMDIFCLHQ